MSTLARSVRDFRNNYNEIISLANNGNQVIITQNGRDVAAVIGTQAYKEFEIFLHHQYITSELSKTKLKASDSTTKWISEEEFWDSIEEEK